MHKEITQSDIDLVRQLAWEQGEMGDYDWEYTVNQLADKLEANTLIEARNALQALVDEGFWRWTLEGGEYWGDGFRLKIVVGDDRIVDVEDEKLYVTILKALHELHED